jgi:hypothetical protein
MADISTLEEALAAADAGADLVATTLWALLHTHRTPDFELIHQPAYAHVPRKYIYSPKSPAGSGAGLAIVVGQPSPNRLDHGKICRSLKTLSGSERPESGGNSNNRVD